MATIAGGGLRARHRCEAPLERFAVRIEAIGEQHDDAAAILRGESGRPVPVELDLSWETLGEPYAYRMTTRYEIPCRVAGRVRVGDEELELRAVGQRDHSWGTRDWWSAEWMWCAGHLDDGTRFHGVEFRMPDAPPIGVGYVQPPEGGVVEPLTLGPLRLVAPDGRVSSFPRAMCRVAAADGRTGVAWVEWNRNRSA